MGFGLGLGQFALLLFLQAFLGLSVGLLLNTLIDKPDNANMLGGAIFVLTTVMAGSFSSIAKDTSLFAKITNVLPQRAILELARLFAQSLPLVNNGFFFI